MEAFKNILMPTDYSPSADVALGHAIRLARATGAHLVVLHVVPAPRPEVDPSNLWGSGEDTAKKETERLAQHVARLAGGAGVDIEVEATWGHPAARIIEVARDHHSDLIVMGTQGMSKGKDRAIGGVAQEVLRTAPCAVLTVRPLDEGPAAPGDRRGEGARVSNGPTVESVVQQVPVTITQSQSLAEAHALMTQHGVHQLPVVEDGKLIGILSERDLRPHVGYLERTKVDAAMTRAPVTVSPAETVQQAARILIEQNINALPVVQGDRLLGIVSRTDLLRLLVNLLGQRRG
jgi:CBS domain-containing protein/nucleotide-binding universal stress UspA family protein